MSTTIQVRVDDDLKIKSDSLFKDLGMDTTTAIRIFLTQAVANNGFPFVIQRKNPYAPLTENQIYDKLEQSCQNVENGEYSSADSMISDLKGKYGL